MAELGDAPGMTEGELREIAFALAAPTIADTPAMVDALHRLLLAYDKALRARGIRLRFERILPAELDTDAC